VNHIAPVSPLAHGILKSAPVPILVVDEDGAVSGANARARRLVGRETTGSPLDALADILPGFPFEVWKAGRFATEDIGHAIATRWSLRTADGRSVPVDVQPARFVDGETTILALFLNDASERVRAEEKVQELRLRISHNWRLNSLGEMASVLAHELNQPLAALANRLYNAGRMLEADALDVVGIQEQLAAAEQQTHRAGDTIRRMRSLTRHDAGFHENLETAELVSEILTLLELSAREAGATIETDVPPGRFVRGDRVQVQQLIANLVRNALDAPANERPRRVLISGAATADGGYEVTVADNGPGIAPEMAASLFEPLTSSKPGGMGLGLTICRTLVRAHEGRIWSHSSRLGGAAFTFTLPSPIEASHEPR